MDEKCLLEVKELMLENEDEIKDISFSWLFLKETGELRIKVNKTPNHTDGMSITKIHTAHRDYGKWMS